MVMKPVTVMVFSGLDPTGGAGIQADIQAISAHGGHCLPFVTALTTQDTRHLTSFRTVDTDVLRDQASVLLRDIHVDAIKVGMLGSAGIADVVDDLVDSLPELPLIIDPVLNAGGGGQLSGEAVIDVLKNRLIPRAAVVTPNCAEVRELGGCHESELAARSLLQTGPEGVFVTAGDEDIDASTMTHKLYSKDLQITDYQCQRLPGLFHGTGCTLAAAIAVRLARGECLSEAIEGALEFVQSCIQSAYAIGQGQLIPDRWQG